ncbi:hypothetical protein G5714_024697 [Onychostoma macrolepis]|uniref:Uncharacterized protein n=1 Tax=Onychostoma macrolepis TaxID=369639 RepID=A0A7J6BLQ9_9TELE|nr:hypothetical protein G5714_024697 [Onychostoma macrolepis]
MTDPNNAGGGRDAELQQLRERVAQLQVENERLSVKSAAPAALRALRHCEKVQTLVNAPKPFKVKVQGKSPICLGAGALTMVPVTCPQLETAELLLEPLGFEDGQLPEGLLVSPTLVFAKKGLLYAPVVNVGCTEVWLSPRRVIGTVQAVVATSAGTKLVAFEPSWEEGCAYVSTQEAITSSSVPEDGEGPVRQVHRSELRAVPEGLQSVAEETTPSMTRADLSANPMIREEEGQEDVVIFHPEETQEALSSLSSLAPVEVEAIPEYMTLTLRRSVRSTAGQHPNPYRLLRAVSAVIEEGMLPEGGDQGIGV